MRRLKRKYFIQYEFRLSFIYHPQFLGNSEAIQHLELVEYGTLK